MEDDLISRIHVFVAAKIKGAVREASCVMAEALSHCMSEGCSVAGSKSLAFDAP